MVYSTRLESVHLRVSRVRIPPPPPVRKCLCWLALCEGSPADFKRKLEFFIFQNEVQADIFSGSLAVFQSERVASAGGRKGGLGGIPPALQILGEISSNFFESTPPIGTISIFHFFSQNKLISYDLIKKMLYISIKLIVVILI